MFRRYAAEGRVWRGKAGLILIERPKLQRSAHIPDWRPCFEADVGCR